MKLWINLNKKIMAIEPTEPKVAKMLNWAYEKGMHLFYKTLASDIEKEMTTPPVKKAAVEPPKRSSEPVKWPLPVKK